jgi:hypothetical protein
VKFSVGRRVRVTVLSGTLLVCCLGLVLTSMLVVQKIAAALSHLKF